MPERAELIIDGNPKVARDLSEVDSLLNQIAVKAKQAGLALSAEDFSDVYLRGAKAMREYVKELDFDIVKQREATAALKAYNDEAARNRQLAAFNVSRGQGADRYVDPVTTKAKSGVDLYKEQEAATAYQRQLRMVSQDTDKYGAAAGKAAEKTKSLFSGTALIRQQMLHFAGIEGARAAEVLENIVGSALKLSPAFIFGAGALVALGAVIISETQKIKEAAEKELKELQAEVNKGKLGGQKEVDETLQKYLALRNELYTSNRAQTDVLKEAGYKGGMADLENDIRVLQRRKEMIDRVTGAEAERYRELDELDPTAGQNLRKRIAGLDELERADEKHVNRLIELETKRARERKQGDDEDLRRGAQLLKQDEEEEKARQQFRIQTAALLQSTLEQGRQQLLADNPYVKVFDAASKRAENFERQLGFLPDKIRRPIEQLNAQLQEMDIFKADLASQTRLRDLLDKADDLRDNPLVRGAASERQSENQRQLLQETGKLMAEARDLQRGYGLDPVSALQERVRQLAGLSGLSYAKAVSEATQGVDIGTLDAAGLRYARANALTDLATDAERRRRYTDTAEARQRDSAERAIRDAEARLAASPFAPGSAELRAEEAAAADYVLGILGRIPADRLPPGLLDAQLKYTEQRAGLEGRLREDARKAIEQQTAMLGEVKDALATFSAGLKGAAIVELRDRAAAGVFSVERTGSVRAEGQ